MPVELKNNKLSLIIELPEEGYSGARFDYTGKIRRVIYNGIEFGTTESEKYDLKKGCGFFNEFGIDSPLGYDEIKPGEEFIKPGVGYLIKESDKPYDFFFEYKFRPFDFDYCIEQGKIIYRYLCNSSGYVFEAEKEIALTGNQFDIKYKIENKGDKVIRTNEYVHNFISVNSEKISGTYRLIFPFEIIKEEIHKVIDKENNLIFGGNFLSWKNEPQTEYFLENINCNCKAEWRIINRTYGCMISEMGNFAASKINLWGKRHVVSPELYKKIELNPGEKDEWIRTFTFDINIENV
ncbi:hypothetical protein MROS_0116 [Melioribacter roseus P3M-2]|uniref:Uncharacterized protein n=1 Tax=Melioribacter roseus (strain DSM 23840 / JCM 17771 / VKM B-2668 / P3M-2) TaxID=1191523 RepID=I6Z2I9_MELRP|nr:hypothetical protein [Melioribacter roseus]AFN73360.1 hypothetical protein MROS_0116 [Melioribacter roseus P3M-2]